MEMNLNTRLILEYRNSKAWSQQQLADICGLSLRTIQRVENTGRASQDTSQAIASAFDVEVSKFIEIGLNTEKNEIVKRVLPYFRIAIIASVTVAITMYLWIFENTTRIWESESLSNKGQFLITADKVEIPNKQGITRYLGNVVIQISSTEITEIQSNKMTLKDGLEVFEGGATFITPNFKITLEEASMNKVDQVMRITSAFAEKKLLIE